MLGKNSAARETAFLLWVSSLSMWRLTSTDPFGQTLPSLRTAYSLPFDSDRNWSPGALQNTRRELPLVLQAPVQPDTESLVPSSSSSMVTVICSPFGHGGPPG